ncbi:MAG: 3-dehydroquinate synthase [Lachnospiraceae bacterium]|nr:3-dehydroquinate synthase [Lachnospiraceae bacterium]
MSERLTINFEKKPCYDIVFSVSFDDLLEELNKLNISDRKVCIITDSHVAGLYGDEVMQVLNENCRKNIIFSFQAGEENKTLDTVREAYKFLINEKFDRKDLIIALGGGVVGDVTGFIAATYLRGVDFVQIPTTLLSQSDSSIGGKTGVDFDGYKNMVGAFYMPKLVYMNLSTLKTLDTREYFNGFAEVMKHGLIKDGAFYEWLLDNMYEICDRDLDTLLEMVQRSCMIKKLVVEKDPTEKGDRALLNFGHTIGHAIEKAKNFTLSHGECVALGCIAAAFISWKHEWLSMEEYYEIRDMFVPFNLPISIENINPEEILALTKSDKKAEGNKIKFILLKKVGKAVIDLNVTDEDIINAVKEILYKEDGE